ncbi:MAG: hypothetical protein ACYTGL_04780 [Planctomycetota bacterium]
MKAEQIYCPNCDRPVPADDINISALVGKCVGCDHVFQLEFAARDTAKTDEEPSQPSGITLVEDSAGELAFERRWFHPQLFFMLIFCIVWDAFLIFWYSIALFGDPQMQDDGGWMMIVFPLGHVAVGICLTYYVVAGFLNRTTVRIADDRLTVRHGPVPWIRNRDLTADELMAIELDFAFQNQMQGMYSVNGVLTDGRAMVLLSGLKRRQALYAGWAIARTLGIRIDNEDVKNRRLPWFMSFFGME